MGLAPTGLHCEDLDKMLAAKIKPPQEEKRKATGENWEI